MSSKASKDDVCSSILPAHRQEWLDSGVSHEIIVRNVQSLEDPCDIDAYLNRNTTNRWKHSNTGPGWLVSGVDPESGTGFYLGLQFKPDKPIVDVRGKEKKYLSPSNEPTEPLFLDTENPAYWPSILNDPSKPIIVTEGAKKAGCCLTRGFPAISIPGVACGQKAGSLKDSIRRFCHPQRVFYLAFDSDLLSNRNVRKALLTLGTLLEGESCSVRIMLWDSAWKGIDDYLVAHDESGAIASLMKEAPTLSDWKESFKPKPEDVTVHDYHLILDALEDRLRYNLLSNDVELDGQPFDVGNAKVHLRVDHGIPIRSGNDDATALLLKAARTNTYHPVQEYLDGAYEKHGISPILEGLASKLFGTSDPSHQTLLNRFLVSSVARAYRPGCKHDCAFILQGEQGYNKSSFFKALASEPWFDDSLPPLGDKDLIMKVHGGSWIIEFAELETLFGQRDISKVKSFLSSSTDKVRRPYGRSIETLKRTSVIVGSTNQDEFLRDPTGNRRFWIVPVSKRLDIQFVIEHRDEIWGAAVALYKSGEQWWLTDVEEKLHAESRKAFEEADPLQEVIEEKLRLWAGQSQLTTVEIWAQATGKHEVDCTKRDQMRVSAIMQRLGYRRTQHKVTRAAGSRVRIWVKRDES